MVLDNYSALILTTSEYGNCMTYVPIELIPLILDKRTTPYKVYLTAFYYQSGSNRVAAECDITPSQNIGKIYNSRANDSCVLFGLRKAR